MSAPSRSLSLREARAGQRPRPKDQNTAVADRPGQVKPPLSTTSTSRSIPSRPKSISVKTSASGSAEDSTSSSTRLPSPRKSLLPQLRPRAETTSSGSLQSQREKESEKPTRRAEHGLREEPHATPRPRSLVYPTKSIEAYSPGSGSRLSLQSPKSSSIRPVQKTPSTTRLERSASLRQPTTPRPPPARHVRHRSQVISSNASPIQRSHASPIKQVCTTPQQRSSPRKLSQPPTPTTPLFSNSDNVPLPPHIVSLQTELLQLQLLHAQALETKAKWERNNQAHFQELHLSAAASYHDVVEAENALQRRRNVDAINQWYRDAKGNKSRYSYPEQIQILSRVLQDATTLMSQDGLYTLTLRRFEEWIDHATDVRDGRINPQKGPGVEEAKFIDPLDLEWRENVEMLTVRVELCLRELDCLSVGPGVREGDQGQHRRSALLWTVNGHRALLASMFDELQTIASLEAEVLKWERAWVRNAVDALGPEIPEAPAHSGAIQWMTRE